MLICILEGEGIYLKVLSFINKSTVFAHVPIIRKIESNVSFYDTKINRIVLIIF